VLAAFAAQLLFPVVLIAIAPYLQLNGCPDTEIIKARADQYTWTVIGIELVLVVAVGASLVWWSASRRRRWAWLAAGLTLMVLITAVSLAIAGLPAVNLCNMLAT
jgi:hypothetical protein